MPVSPGVTTPKGAQAQLTLLHLRVISLTCPRFQVHNRNCEAVALPGIRGLVSWHGCQFRFKQTLLKLSTGSDASYVTTSFT